MQVMNSRPFGVLVLGALAIAIAVIRVLVGLQLLGVGIFGDDRWDGTGVIWVGIMAVVVGLIYLAVGWSLWSMKPWALIFTMIMAVFGLVDAMFVLIATSNIAYGIAAAAIPAFLLWYTSRQDIRESFARGRPGHQRGLHRRPVVARPMVPRRPGREPGPRGPRVVDEGVRRHRRRGRWHGQRGRRGVGEPRCQGAGPRARERAQ